MKPEGSVSAAPSSGRPILPTHDASSDKALVLRLEAAGTGAIVLYCQGQIVFRSQARALSSLIMEVLPTARRLVVDLAGVASLDSGALGELVLTQMWAEAAGYDLKLSTPTNSVWRLFEATNLVSVFDVHSTVESALASMQGEDGHLS